MATLVFSALGTLVGGPLGGAIGALLGRQVDSLVLGSPSREGPRLKELTATTSSYGTAIPRVFGSMRVGGTIIWATDLVEHRDTQGGGKGRPSVTSYTYSSSFAVGLASRPISGIGRIWADGNLLRGAAGDLKTGGSVRVYLGAGDQAADPLIAAAEAPLASPGHRGMAYVVFEDLQLADFGNRIPALTFEVFADKGPLSISQLASGGDQAIASDVILPNIAGIAQEGSLADTLGTIQPIIPLFCDLDEGKFTVTGESGREPALLRQPTVATKDGDFGGKDGFQAKRGNLPIQPAAALRYYDIDRDYQPGVQRATGTVGPGQPATIEIPCAMHASAARGVIEARSRRMDWSRQTIQWRTSEIDPTWQPGALVAVPGFAGIWRVLGWEWRSSGIELNLARTPFAGAPAPLTFASDTGRAAVAPDLELGTTWLAVTELPWDGSGAGDQPVLRAAATSASSGWSGAALFLDQGDGQLVALGSTGRRRAIAGTAVGSLPAASSMIADRTSVLTIELVGDGTLVDATARQLAMGANRALIGTEIIQFARANPLGERRWDLSHLLRGRGGTEAEVASHVPGEAFILLDDDLTVIDGRTIGANPVALIKAIGTGDASPVSAQIANRGITQRPLCPVHPNVTVNSDGSLSLAWVRRARGAWIWRDQVDTSLNEQSEAYEVRFGTGSDVVALWNTPVPYLTIPAAQLASLVSSHPGRVLTVRQVGSYAASPDLFLTTLG